VAEPAAGGRRHCVTVVAVEPRDARPAPLAPPPPFATKDPEPVIVGALQHDHPARTTAGPTRPVAPGAATGTDAWTIPVIWIWLPETM